jgi:hypothetical protein
MYNPIFSPKDFEREKANIDSLLTQIPDLEGKRKIIVEWAEAIENGTIEKRQEEEIQSDFLNLIFGEVLDYKYGVNLSEINLRKETQTLEDFTKPDGVLGFFKNTEKDATDVRAVIELKKFNINLDKQQNRKDFKGTPVEQGFGYASKFGTQCHWVIISDFAEIRLYRYPNQNNYERFHILTLLEEANLRRFLFLLYKNQLFQKLDNEEDIGTWAVAKKLYKGRMDFLEDITNRFYQKYHFLRLKLFAEIKENNTSFVPALLFSCTQKILDRLIFMRFTSDIDLTEHNIVHNFFNALPNLYSNDENTIWYNLKNLFISFDKGYRNDIPPFNGGLFAPIPEMQQLIVKEKYLKEALSFVLDYDFKNDLKVDILGHIFEQSITDIQRLQDRNFEFDTKEVKEEQDIKTSERKQYGVFYTPKYVTQYIIRQSIGGWLDDRKQEIFEELGIVGISEPELDLKEWRNIQPELTLPEVRNTHLAFWEKYKKVLDEVKVLDPSCGSGAFLNEVFNFLYEENANAYFETEKLMPKPVLPPAPPPVRGKKKKILSEIDLFAQTEKAKPKLPEELDYQVRRSILLTNIFGVDLNFESIEITKLSLWLQIANRKRPLPMLADNIKRGNSLIEDKNLSEWAFSWENEFPHIFAQGGFDIVVGNPPYVSIKSIKEKEKSYFLEKYQTAIGQFDLYGLFVERAMTKLAKNKAKIGCIISSTFISNKDFWLLRKYLFENLQINHIAYLGETVFTDANVDVSILCVTKKSPKNGHQIKVIRNRKDFDEDKFHWISQSRFNSGKNNYEIKLNSQEGDFNVIDKIYEDKLFLANILDLPRGIEIGGNSEKITREPKEGYQKLLVGKNIQRYVTQFDNLYLRFENDKSVFKELEIYTQPKILIQRIRNLSLKQRIVATLDMDNLLCTNTLRIGVLKNLDYDLKFILGILNSTLINFIFSKFFLNKDIYAHQLERVPIPAITITEQQKIIESVSTQLSISQLLYKKQTDFIYFLSNNFVDLHISRKIESWFENTFEDLENELQKQGIDFSPIDYKSWQENFEKQKNEILSLKNEIQFIDNQIDSLVYQLYDLTPDEITLIENAS